MSEGVPTGVCVRCGETKPAYDAVCSGCGNQPSDEGLMVAWLLSSANLSPREMKGAAARVKRGEEIRPNAKMLRRARRALGRDLTSDPGLSVRERLGLLLCSLLLTPLVGWSMWLWWRRERPRAALQALSLSLPPSVLFTAIWIWLYLTPS